MGDVTSETASRLRAFARPYPCVQIMGVVNRTPDSFYDGGRYQEDDAARARIDRLVQQGADIIDVGAESTRPGAPAVSAREQIARLGEVIAYASRLAIVSIDTTLPEVAAQAIAQGARMINSVSLAPAADLARIAKDAGCDLVLTHCRGSMSEMSGFSEYRADGYGDVVADVAREWNAAAAVAVAAGLPPDRLICDPGLGFAKSAEQSLTLCAGLAELKERVGRRILVGPGRKSYLARAVAGVLGGEPPAPDDRLGATLCAALDSATQGADILRVHDVGPLRQALAYLQAVTARQDGRAQACSKA
jgi:dihydropteroate synthase